MRIPTYLTRLPGPVTVVLLSLSACSSDPFPTQPGSATESAIMDDATASLSYGGGPGGRSFFPLDLGNRWTYRTQYETFVISDSCDTLPGGVIVCESSGSIGWGGEHREIVGTEELFGREYVVEAQKLWRMSFDPIDTTTYWTRYRQDRTGLYEADVPFSQPPGSATTLAVADNEGVRPAEQRLSAALKNNGARLTPAQAAAYDAAMERIQQKLEVVASAKAWHGHPPRLFGGRRGGTLDQELTRLKYPLHPGQHWTIREVPLFTSRVVRHEVLRLPAGRLGGWRIQISSELFDPGDKVYLWYGRTGFLKLSVSLKGIAVDEWGNRIGTAVYQEGMELESFNLVSD